MSGVAVALAAAGCGPILDRAPYPARPDTVMDGELLGPFDGIVVEADNDRPVAGALVAASWAFERGVGLQGPLAAVETTVETGPDGRYVIPRLDSLPSGLSTRLRRFTLVVYKKGFVGWRSDRRLRGGIGRRDFSQRANRARLERWEAAYRHADHLVFLGGGSKVRAAAAWEAQAASLELEGGEAGSGAAGAPAGAEAKTAGPALLDVSGLLSEDEVRGVTGFVGRFEIGRLVDLPTTEFYDSRHFKAEGRPETYDVAVRVWRLGPAAAEAQYRKLLAELPGATTTDEIGDASLRAKAQGIVGLAFLARERGAVISLTCGVAQCTDPSMILKLAKLLESRLGALPTVGDKP